MESMTMTQEPQKFGGTHHVLTCLLFFREDSQNLYGQTKKALTSRSSIGLDPGIRIEQKSPWYNG